MASERSSFIVRVAKENETRRIRVVVPRGSTWDEFLSLLRSRFQLGSQDIIEVEDNRGSQVICLEDVLDDDELVIKLGDKPVSGRGPAVPLDIVLWAALSSARLSDFRLQCSEPVKRDRMVVTASLPSMASSRLHRLIFVGGDLVQMMEESVSSILARFDDGRLMSEVVNALILARIPRHPNVLRWWTRFDVNERIYDTLPGRMMYQLKDSLLPLIQTHGTATVLVFDHHTLTLKKMLDELPKPLSLSTVLQLLLDISSVLSVLTEHRLVLRNVDMSQMQISSSGSLILSDFRTLCTSAELSTASASSLNSLLTPPELVDDAAGTRSSATDETAAGLCHTWSLGLVGCCITTGVSTNDVAGRHEQILDPLLEIYPEELVQLLKSCLDVDPTKRPSLAVVQAALLCLQQCDPLAEATEQQQAVVVSVENSSSAEAEPQPELVSVGQTVAAELQESDHENTREATRAGDGIGLLTFPIAELEPSTQSADQSTRAMHNQESNRGPNFHGEIGTSPDAPPSYAEVCGDAEARSLDTPSSSDDEMTAQIDVPPPVPVTRPTRPHPMSRHRWRRAFSAVMLRDFSGLDEIGGQRQVQRHNETTPLGYSDDEPAPIPLLSDVEVPNEAVHADYAAADLEQRFCDVTSATRSVARSYLTLCGGELEDAISVYMEASRSSQPPLRYSRQGGWSTAERRPMLGRPRLRSEGSQDHASSLHDIHQWEGTPLRTSASSHRQSWAGLPQVNSSRTTRQQQRRRISEGSAHSFSVRPQPTRPRGWYCPHSREPRDCPICALISSAGDQSREQHQRTLPRRERNRQRRKQPGNCKLS